MSRMLALLAGVLFWIFLTPGIVLALVLLTLIGLLDGATGDKLIDGRISVWFCVLGSVSGWGWLLFKLLS